MKDFRPAKKRVEVSVGESVRILHELQELSQCQLSELTAIPQATISAIENGPSESGSRTGQGARPFFALPSGGAGFPWLGSGA